MENKGHWVYHHSRREPVDSKQTEGRIPVADLHNWIGHLKQPFSKTKKQDLKDRDRFRQHHYKENVRVAKLDGLNFEQFFSEIVSEIKSEYPDFDEEEIDYLKNELSDVWN
jgi:hypothetical protein